MKRILIVEDEPDLLEALAFALEDRYEVRTAANGRGALELLAAESFDAMIVDLMMPVMSGAELIRALDAASRPPIVVLSAGRDLRETCAELGITHYLQKPYRLSDLLEKIAAVLQPGDGSSGGTAPDGAPGSSGNLGRGLRVRGRIAGIPRSGAIHHGRVVTFERAEAWRGTNDHRHSGR
ncbi:MAG TPA: response regulator [Kofleriaceae bacterium]|nr:response regulator [Kofleriaceae bacterium]